MPKIDTFYENSRNFQTSKLQREILLRHGYTEKDAYNSLKELSHEIHKFFIASKCTLVEGKSEKIKIKASANEKCSRCWHREEDLNSDGICVRCEDNINGDGETRSFF